jgi:outer membrane murein-binding lipoprotein Lpp
MPERKTSCAKSLQSLPFRSRLLGVGWVVAACLLVAGCSKKDQAKCDEALSAGRQAIKSGQQDLLTQWRNRAWKYCEDPAAVPALDREVVAAQQAEQERKAKEAAEKQKVSQLANAFSSWVGANRAAANKASAVPECPEKQRGKKEEERFCVATRRAGPYEFKVRYWEAEPVAARFTMKPGVVMSCADFGPTREIHSFGIPSTTGKSAKRSVCEFTGGVLNGMQLVMTEATNADVHVFTKEYLERDPGMKKYIGG